MKKISLVLPLAAVALMGLGCNPFAKVQEKVNEKVAEGIVERALESAGGGKVDVDVSNGGGALTFRDAKTGEYTALGEGAKIPDDFPNDIPQYSGATNVAVSIQKDKAASLTQVTPDDLAKVTTWFENEMKGKGFTLASTLDLGPEAKMFIYEKGNVKVAGTFTTSEGKTSLMIVRNEE